MILNDAKDKIRSTIDENIENAMGEYGLMPNSINPIDFLIAEARSKVRKE
jgi:hypothetical protein